MNEGLTILTGRNVNGPRTLWGETVLPASPKGSHGVPILPVAPRSTASPGRRREWMLRFGNADDETVPHLASTAGSLCRTDPSEPPDPPPSG